MASTVEQGEIKSLRPLSSTLELFDAFKTDEDKDSDEESFHLPLLGCDDDNDTENGKEDTLDLATPNGETEDDILNKFEINTSEDVDPKQEQLLLGEDDETSKNDTRFNTYNKKNDCESLGSNNLLLEDLEIVDDLEESYDKTENSNNITELDNDLENTLKNETLDSSEINLNSKDVENGDSAVDKIDNLNVLPEADKKEECSEPDSKITKENKVDDVQEEDSTSPSELEEEIASKKEELTPETDDTDTKLDDQIKEDEIEFMELDVQDVPQMGLDDNLENAVENDNLEGAVDNDNLEDAVKNDNLEDAVENNTNLEDAVKNNTLEDTVKNGDTQEKQERDESEEKVTDSGGDAECVDMDVDDIMETKSHTKDVTDERVSDIDELKEKCEEHKEAEEKPSNAEESESKEIELQKEECEDLLDISIIRDADEDDASAIDDITDTLSNEKSDDNDEQDDKQENDSDDIVTSDKDENIDFDEGNTNSCDQETSTTDMVVSEHISDRENKDSEIMQSESYSIDDVTEINSNHSFVDTENKCEDQVVEKSSESKEQTKNKSVEISDKQPEAILEEKPTSPSTGKRPHLESDNESLPTTNKKIRLSEELADENKTATTEKTSPVENKPLEENTKNDQLNTLITFDQFMKQRNLGDGKLTRSDLEQFCLQKICEVLIHKTDTGELYQTIKKQEQMIDTLRKEIQQLVKQTRDLDIVNKKLMTELRTQNLGQKPLVPLKITRSVGLQVKLNMGSEPVARRRSHSGQAPSPRTPTAPITPAAVNRQRIIQPNNNIVRQVVPANSSTPPRKVPAAAPILTQALQTRPTPTPAVSTPSTAVKRPLMRSKPAEPQKPAAPGVIDLTDEDDKMAKNTVLNKGVSTPIKMLHKNGIPQNKITSKSLPLKVQPKSVGQIKANNAAGAKGMPTTRTVTTLPQGVRLSPAQMKNGITIPASVVTSSSGGTPQLMYVVQPNASGHSGTGMQKAVLLNFQPTTNGVLTSSLNGSTVSMIPSKSSNLQLKPISTVTRKHPAPLPLPPPAIINGSLKPLLPKPHLSIRKTDNGIILQWRMPYNLDIYEGIASYQLFAYQETNAPPSTDMWRKVGDVKALALPMACTLTQFADKNKYYFAVRSVDVHKRIGAFSEPEEISL